MKKSASDTTGTKQPWYKAYFSSLNFLGTIIGAFFVYFGFLPSLLPRGWILQGLISGILFATGYGIGLVVSHFVRKFNPSEPRPDKRAKIKKYTFIILGVLYVIAVILGYMWQKEVHRLIEVDPPSGLLIVPITLSGILVAVFLLLIARSIRTLFLWLKRLGSKFIPKAVAYTAAWLLSALLVYGILTGVILSGFGSIVNESFSVRNGTTDEGIVQPTNEHLSGSSKSLIKWETLGRQGRSFIGLANPTEELTAFNKAEAVQPVRAYAGLESAGSTSERAELATADLKRAGGFDRKIIVVATTTGTGWVDEAGVSPIEYMYNGDSAIVSMQYSYLPSWLSFLVDQQKAKDAGSELYNAVYNEALNLPVEKRPKIVVFGESLGSFGGESAFANEASFRATSNGAVWAGPPNFNILRKTATEKRAEDSSEILPVFKDGQTLRFVYKPDDLNKPNKPWGDPRAVYLENPSDPIVWWSPSLLYDNPDWLQEKRGADVSSQTMWLPIITFLQVSGDMLFSTDVPDGHGHKYGQMPTDAWSYVAPPDGWTSQKTTELKQELVE